MRKHSFYPTLIGYLGLLLWSTSGVVATYVVNLPTFEVLSIAFSTSFFVSTINIVIKRRWFILKQRTMLWIIGTIGIFGSESLYIAAVKYAPTSHIDLIYYTWPMMLIMLSRIILKEKIRKSYLIAGSLSFFSIYLLILKTKSNELGYINQYMFGYILALTDAFFSSIYVLGQRYFKETPTELIGVFCGIGMLCSLFCHFQFEPTVIPNFNEWLLILYMGFSTQGIAYFLWDYGVKRGNYLLLSMLSYANAFISMLWLVLFGITEFSIDLLTAFGLMTTALIIMNFKIPRLNKNEILKIPQNSV